MPDFLKQIARPPFPTLGHFWNAKQPVGFVVSACVDAKHIANGESVIRSLDHADLVSGCQITLDKDAQVSPGAQRLGEAARKHLVIHPDAKAPAWDARLGNLENGGPNLPALADERLVRVNSLRCEVFAKLTGLKEAPDFLFPPMHVFDSVGVDRLVGTTMGLAIRLVVTGKIDTSGGDPPEDR
jgi:hypothetical protein